MGYAILFIMLSHATNPGWADLPILNQITGKLTSLVHTSGFLILSGFGLYYSYSKNQDVTAFFKRRLLRLYIPFLLISLPFYFYTFATGGDTIGAFILNILGLSFFVNGSGQLWYISISLLMYALTPLLYSMIFGGKHSGAKALCIVIMMVFGCYAMSMLIPSYYRVTEIGYAKAFMYIIGMYVGYLSLTQKTVSWKAWIGIIVFFVCLVVLQKYNTFFKILYKDAIPVWGIPLLTTAFSKLEKLSFSNPFFTLLRWLGRYSLELYILHVLIKCTLYYACFDLYGMDKVLLTKQIIVGVTLVSSFALCAPVHIAIDKLLNRIK